MTAVRALLLLCALSALSGLGSGAPASRDLQKSGAGAGALKKLYPHAENDEMLNKLDEALQTISSVYAQALFDRTYTPAHEKGMAQLESELFDMLDALYQSGRMNDYMRYEAEVTRRVLQYNYLKRLFGYSDDNEQAPRTVAKV